MNRPLPSATRASAGNSSASKAMEKWPAIIIAAPMITLFVRPSQRSAICRPKKENSAHIWVVNRTVSPAGCPNRVGPRFIPSPLALALATASIVQRGGQKAQVEAQPHEERSGQRDQDRPDRPVPAAPRRRRDRVGVPDGGDGPDDGHNQQQLEQPHPDVEAVVELSEVAAEERDDGEPADAERDEQPGGDPCRPVQLQRAPAVRTLGLVPPPHQ